MKPGNWPGRAPGSMRAANRAGERCVAVRLRLAAGVIVRLMPGCASNPVRVVGDGVFERLSGEMAEYRNQHVVPVLSLQHFTDQRGQVWSYDKTNGRTWSAIPEETGFITHFYSFEREDGTMDTTIEKLIGQIEAAAANGYEKLAAGEMIKGSDREAFAQFAGLMVSRTPTQRRIAAKIYALGMGVHLAATGQHEDAFKSMVERMRKDGLEVRDADLPTLRESMSDLSEFEVAIPKELTLRSLELADVLTRVFLDMKWSLWRPGGHYFITCDNPVVRNVDEKTVHAIMGDDGYMNKTAQVTLPLSPRMMVCMMWDKGWSWPVEMPREYVKAQNLHRAFNAENCLYAHLEDKRVLRLAQKYKDQRPDMDGGTFGGSKGFGSVVVPRRRPKRDS